MADAKTLFDKFGFVYDSGKVIFEENQDGDQMYIIQEGNVRISKTIDGKPHTLAVLGKGDFFGEMAIVTSVKRTATATAAGTVRLLAFDRPGFLSMIAKNVRIALNVIDKLCRRLQAANSQIYHLVSRNEKDLIAMNLYHSFAEHGMEKAVLDTIKVSRDISLNLEFSTEKILNFFQDLEKRGIVRSHGGHLMLINKAALEAIAESAGGPPAT
ncbi:MAG: Crp/Fnr family transcriptional regulator [Spirochaetales bacterium]|jgi:CRP/FNR family transcriptional regulator, cyclic AMP receptor protein|nr:Crp/Fnr family transcriptional regulator [Spirochaetales bacterium]